MQLFTLPEPKEKGFKVKRRNIVDPDISMLKSQQLKAFKEITDFLFKENHYLGYLLSAPAGCGKTFLCGKIIEKYLHRFPTAKIAVVAPTNKAVKVAYRTADFYHPNVEYLTVHKLLGLKEAKAGANIIFVQDYQNPPKMDMYDLVICDEASMLGADLLFGVEPDDKKNRKPIKGLISYMHDGIKILFVGDEYQIPPVNSPDNPIFTESVRASNHIGYFHMTEVVRQALDNPIIELATYIRENVKSRVSLHKFNNKYWDGDKGIYFIDRSSAEGKKFLKQLLNHVFASENFNIDPDFAKVIAYRNDVVHKANRNARKIIFKGVEKLRRVEVGEKLIALEPIIEDRSIVMPTNEEMEVVEMSLQHESINDGQLILPYYHTLVRYWRFDNSEHLNHIKILTFKGQELYNNALEKMAAYANSLPRGVLSQQAWGQFWQFKEGFANVGYNYGITAHRSQGSTYRNVIVMANDIQSHFKREESNRILYTATTRPSERLFIVV